MFSLDGLSAATVNPTLACRDTIQDKPTIVAQSLEVVTGSRGRLGIQKGPITSFWGAVIMWIMVKFFSEAGQCGSGLISCPCSHTVWIKKLTDEVEKEGGREREKERKDRETEFCQQHAWSQASGLWNFPSCWLPRHPARVKLFGVGLCLLQPEHVDQDR